jgi:mono/diheme cytochrome c family protein
MKLERRLDLELKKEILIQNLLMSGVTLMTRLNKETSLWVIRAIAICTVFVTVPYCGGRLEAQDKQPWVAPEAARSVKNPVAATPENLEAAAKTFNDNCMMCHGEKGKGDGPFSALDPKPANFTDSKLMSSETDGSLFWKMSEGRGPMPPWKDTLSEKERWQLVNYLRKLNKDANADPDHK